MTEHASGASVVATVERLRETFATGRTRSLDWRLEQLFGIERFLREESRLIEAALGADLGKPALEAYLTDEVSVRREVQALRRGLPRWIRPTPKALPVVLLPGSARVVREPKGVALIVSPCNYPINLVLVPLAAAIAAGNCALVKPSELAPATSSLLANRLDRYVDAEAVAVLEGAGEIATVAIETGVDHVFFTGSARVGRLVMESASRQLTPVTLECGGKSPAVVWADTDPKVAARRILWGKFLNAGQTCVAPDYVLVHSSIRDRFVQSCAEALDEFYGNDPRASDDFGRIVDVEHFDRLVEMLDEAVAAGAAVVRGAVTDRSTRYVAPTIVTDIPEHCALRREEIFGPILPIIAFETIGEVSELTRSVPVPLAKYLFTNDRLVERDLIEAVPGSSVCVNATLQQFGAPSLPFGGRGESGFGMYHGRWGFETFSHLRTELRRPLHPDWRVAYPPYRAFARALFRRVL